MKLSKQAESQVIQRFFDLYITAQYKYLIMDQKGRYITFNSEENKNHKQLGRWHIKEHLNDVKTLGIYAPDFITRFICFDIDVVDKANAKWTTYKLVHRLIEIGIPEEYIYISTSGNKGYHVDIYFEKIVIVEVVQDLYNIVMNGLDMTGVKGQIELRPTSQGLKLPLGRNFKNKDQSTNKCWYVDYNNGLKPIRSYKYILDIKQISTELIRNVIHKHTGIDVFDITVNDKEGIKVETAKGYFDSKYKSIQKYGKNIDTKITIEAMEKLENEGLQTVGTRHNSLFDLSRYYRHLGMSLEENKAALIEWMNNQDTRMYRTSLKDCYKDIKEIVKYVYDKDVSLLIEPEERDLKVYYDEMVEILKADSKNEKLLLYSMLIHSKRYATEKGNFYMTYNQMVESSGLSERTVKRLVNKLEESKLIEIVERNRKVRDSNGNLITKKPNIYKILIKVDTVDETQFININDPTDLNNALLSLFELNVLKDILPDRHYREIYKVSNI